MKKALIIIIFCIFITVIVTSCHVSGSPAMHRTVVSETLVTQIDSPSLGSPLIYSPDARRVAYIADRDGKKSLVVDGVFGKKYDSIKINFRTFSPDSKRVAYVAVIYGEKPPVGNRWFVVIDGEEGESYNSATFVTFSPDNKHVAYVADGCVFLDRVQVKGPEGMPVSGPIFSPDSQSLVYVVERNSKQSVVADGVPGKQYDRIGTIAFSPSSKNLAYRAKAGKNCYMVIDGREEKRYEAGPSVFNPIVFSPDSKRLAYVAGGIYESLDHREYREFVVLDGKELTRHKNISGDLVFSPDSSHLAYNADAFIFLDDVKKGVCNGGFIGFMFSPDSTRLAYGDIKTGWWGQTTAAWAVVDGVKCKEYDGVRDVTFSPDSKYVAYIAGQGKKQFVVVDEQKGKEYDTFGRDFGVSVSTLGLKRIVWDSIDCFHYLVQKGNGIYLVEEIISGQ